MNENAKSKFEAQIFVETPSPRLDVAITGLLHPKLPNKHRKNMKDDNILRATDHKGAT